MYQDHPPIQNTRLTFLTRIKRALGLCPHFSLTYLGSETRYQEHHHGEIETFLVDHRQCRKCGKILSKKRPTA